jgi:flagellar basal-body rod protein FlgB
VSVRNSPKESVFLSSRPARATDIIRMIGKTAQVELLTQILDAAALRHAVISQNLANVNTPNYKRREVTFEGELERAISGHGGTAQVHPKIVETPSNSERKDGNTVDIDVEMSQLNKNTLMANAATQMLAMKLAQLRSAITGR